jgi:hypothetical protein
MYAEATEKSKYMPCYDSSFENVLSNNIKAIKQICYSIIPLLIKIQTKRFYVALDTQPINYL